MAWLFNRRCFLSTVSAGAVGLSLPRRLIGAPVRRPERLPEALADEGIFSYLDRTCGGFDEPRYKRLLGAANEFKEGDEIVGVAAGDEAERQMARRLLSRTRLADIDAHPTLVDGLYHAIQKSVSAEVRAKLGSWTFADLKQFLLSRSEDDIRTILPGLSSDVIGCVVKLMDNAELTAIGAQVFNPLPGTKIGAKGYLGARIQPNSPTDNVDDIRWQVLNGWAFAVGDVVLGNNPVSSEPKSVAAIERTLQDLLETFGLTETLPHCVLSHIDVQAQVERDQPGSTALWFQSIAGSDSANKTFDISVEKMEAYAAERRGPFGLYFETGQGADFTNGHSHGFDMVLHESRKYGFARRLSQLVAHARGLPSDQAWVHLNDVAGFIGPEVFRTREQLVRCCLEDIVMGKLHGLCLGLDVCSTLHMDVSLDDLDWCLEQLVPAQPAYLMALPTKIDPMLGYLTTGYHDHVRLREKFGCRVDDRLWKFFQDLQVIDQDGRPTKHFGDPLWVFLQYRLRKADPRPHQQILDEGRAEMAAVRSRGVFLAEGYGERPSTPPPRLLSEIHQIYDDAKACIWAELPADFAGRLPESVPLITTSRDRREYILHPETGERLNDVSQEAIASLRKRHNGRFDVQIVLSDGLNALSILDEQQLQPFLTALRAQLTNAGFRAAPEVIVVRSGRVRAGYRIGEQLFANLSGHRGLVHVIGERPGSGHRTFSTYLTAVPGTAWGKPGEVDHNVTLVVAGIAKTAYAPNLAAADVTRLLQSRWS